MAIANHTKEIKHKILSLRMKARQHQRVACKENSQLALWPASVRACPTGVLCSALFGAICKTSSPVVQRPRSPTLRISPAASAAVVAPAGT